VIEMGYVDPKHIGINGHSYGGEGAAFIGTRYACLRLSALARVLQISIRTSARTGLGVSGAGGSGANGNDYYLYVRSLGLLPVGKAGSHMYESALTHVPEVTAPFLIMHGTSDPTVAFQNVLGSTMRCGTTKNAILLAYTGEGHGLRGLGNRKDLTVRYFQFFDHYLKARRRRSG